MVLKNDDKSSNLTFLIGVEPGTDPVSLVVAILTTGTFAS